MKRKKLPNKKKSHRRKVNLPNTPETEISKKLRKQFFRELIINKIKLWIL